MTEIPSAYEPKRVEERWYAYWLAKGEFHAVPDPSRQPYTIMMPLPNVTGELHMGHALNNGLQDCLTRWSRMRGLNALWQPGLDHASIAVHVVMERRLAEKGLTRFDLGRERFLAETWKWKEQIGGTILGQLRRLECTCDWDRTVFTMDPGYSDAVLECFIRLFKKGLIYKGKDDQLVPQGPDERLRPGGRVRPDAEHAVLRAVPRGGRRGRRGGGHPASRDDPGRRGSGGSSGG